MEIARSGAGPDAATVTHAKAVSIAVPTSGVCGYPAREARPGIGTLPGRYEHRIYIKPRRARDQRCPYRGRPAIKIEHLDGLVRASAWRPRCHRSDRRRVNISLDIGLVGPVEVELQPMSPGRRSRSRSGSES